MEGKKPISASVKTEVYQRAKGRCESCRDKLTRAQGDFHHWGSPKIASSAVTVQFLCPICHRKYGHTTKVVTHRGILRKWKETTIVRLKVGKHPKKTGMLPRTKPKTKKKKATKKMPIKKRASQKKRRSNTPSRGKRNWFFEKPPKP
jgi:hypothetical protein